MAKRYYTGQGLSGIENVMKNLKKEFSRMKSAGIDGMLEAAAVVRADMDNTPPLIPVHTGNLRNSWFITSSKGVRRAGKGDQAVVANAASRAKLNTKPLVIMGFSAAYSVFVHEAKYEQGRRPGSGPKFFEASLIRNSPVILEIIAKRIKRSGA